MHPIIDDHGQLQGFDNGDDDERMSMAEIAHYSFDGDDNGGEGGDE